MSYQTVRGHFLSADKVHKIPYSIFTPQQGAPKGIIQIIHGMSECAARYEQGGTVGALCEGGYIVCSSDYLGHGGAVNSPDEYGDVADANLLIEDIRSLRTLLRTKYRHLPYFFLGHSMGSFLLRRYLQDHPDEMDGAMIMGTSGGNDPAAAGWLISKAACLIGLGRKKAPLFASIMRASCNRQLKPAGKGDDWLVSDPALLAPWKGNVDHGFPFTCRGYAALFGLMKTICDEEFVANTPRSVPIYLLSGEDDPVGGMGEGVKHLHAMLFEAGVDDLTMTLYPSARHEILNETIKEQVWADMLAWADDQCKSIASAQSIDFGGRSE